MTPILVAVIAVGACAVDEPELGETEQLGRYEEDTGDACPSCGGNGFSEGAFNYMFGQYDRNSLNTAGAWNGATDNPHSLCQSHGDWVCDLRPAYSQWLRQGLTNKRVQIMTEVVRVVARQGYEVRDTWAGGNTYYGKFGIAPGALDGSDRASAEKITAGLMALLDPVADVPICLTVEDKPNGCVGSGATWHESTTFGFHFRYAWVGIAGGKDAKDPKLNKRYGNVTQSTANETPKWTDFKCVHAGQGETRVATSCTGANGQTYSNPVTVLTPFDPSTFYYDRPLVERPPHLPHVL